MEEKTLLSKLQKVKAEIGKVSKDSKNPFFKSKYFDINQLLEHVEPLMDKNGLVLLQPINDGCVTTEIHCVDSKEKVISSLTLPNIADPQKIGSAITYYRRYTLASLLGLQAEDDDGNKASKPVKLPKLNEAKLQELLTSTDVNVLRSAFTTYELTDSQKTVLTERGKQLK